MLTVVYSLQTHLLFASGRWTGISLTSLFWNMISYKTSILAHLVRGVTYRILALPTLLLPCLVTLEFLLFHLPLKDHCYLLLTASLSYPSDLVFDMSASVFADLLLSGMTSLGGTAFLPGSLSHLSHFLLAFQVKESICCGRQCLASLPNVRHFTSIFPQYHELEHEI